MAIINKKKNSICDYIFKIEILENVFVCILTYRVSGTKIP